MTRVVVYRSPDPGEIDYRWLAIAWSGGKPGAMAAGQSEEIARDRLERARPQVGDEARLEKARGQTELIISPTRELSADDLV